MSQSGRSLRQRAGRGQTLPDFAVGVAVFLLVVTFVFLFIPQLALPFDDQEQPAVAERVTSDLSYNLLASGEARSELNETCTLAFFELEDVIECETLAEEPVTDQLGIASTYSVNITFRNVSSDAPDSMVCRADYGGPLDDCGTGQKPVEVGSTLPDDDRTVATARQRVYVNDVEGVLEVRVW